METLHGSTSYTLITLWSQSKHLNTGCSWLYYVISRVPKMVNTYLKRKGKCNISSGWRIQTPCVSTHVSCHKTFSNASSPAPTELTLQLLPRSNALWHPKFKPSIMIAMAIGL